MRPGLVVLLLALSVPGCFLAPKRSSNNHALLTTPMGSILRKLWDAHGGLEAWQRVGRAHTTVRVEGDPPALEVPPRNLRFDLRDWRRLEIGESEEVLLERQGHSEDYHLHAARMFFHLPFSLSEPGWELRRDLLGGVESDNGVLGFWAIPTTIPSPHVGYYLVMDAHTGLLKTVYYQVRHPHFEGRVYAAEYRRYRWVQGICIATEIFHRALKWIPRERRIEPVDPFDPAKKSWTITPTTSREDPFPPLNSEIHWTLVYENIILEEVRHSQIDDAEENPLLESQELPGHEEPSSRRDDTEGRKFSSQQVRTGACGDSSDTGS